VYYFFCIPEELSEQDRTMLFVFFSILFSLQIRSREMILSLFKKDAGKMLTQKRELPSFTGISNSGVFDIKVFCGKEQSVTVTAGEKIIDRVKTIVEDNNLMLTIEDIDGSQKTSFSFGEYKNSKIEVNIEIPDITFLNVYGVCRFEMFDVNNEKLDLNVEGAASLKVLGTTKNSSVVVSGAASINTIGLKAENVRVKSGGASHVEVFASNELDLNLEGVSLVHYAGNPQSIKKEICDLALIKEIK
jgi:hypothetical protein